MANRNVWFWRDLYALLKRLAKDTGVSFNRLVNLAVQGFLGQSSLASEELKLRARLAQLLREESNLRRQSRVMLRSGSFLPKYADRILRPQESFVREGQQPLRALSKKEEQIFRRILARREKIVKEIVEIQDKLLPKEKFRLKPKRSRSRRRDKNQNWR